MSTRCSIKYSCPDDAPGYHLYSDVNDFEPDPPVYLELFGVEAQVSTGGYVHVVIPRAMARALGLLRPARQPPLSAPADPPPTMPRAGGKVDRD